MTRGVVLAFVLSLCFVAGAAEGRGGVASAGQSTAAVRPCSQGLVALTFDDGPSTTVTGALLGILRDNRVPATFFVVGERVAAAPDLAQSAYRQGFAIANHSYRHEMLTRLADEDVRVTLRATDELLRHLGIRPVPLMRPPYGATNARVRSVVHGMGLTSVLWDVDPRDWEEATPRAISALVLGGLRPGKSNVVLLHDGVRRSHTTLRAVPAIVRGARSRGYCFADLGPTGRPVPPVPEASVSNAAATEGAPANTDALEFTVRLDRPTSQSVSVRVRTAELTTQEGEDYRSARLRVQFPAGVVTRKVTVKVHDDQVDETGEQLQLLLSEPRGLRLQDHVGVGLIRDDDPSARLSVGDASVTEPVVGTIQGTVLVSLDRPSSRPVTVTLATSPLEADEADYVPFEVARVIEAGKLSIEVPVEVRADTVEEPTERFQVRVLSLSGAVVAKDPGLVAVLPPPQPPG